MIDKKFRIFGWFCHAEQPYNNTENTVYQKFKRIILTPLAK